MMRRSGAKIKHISTAAPIRQGGLGLNRYRVANPSTNHWPADSTMVRVT